MHLNVVVVLARRFYVNYHLMNRLQIDPNNHHNNIVQLLFVFLYNICVDDVVSTNPLLYKRIAIGISEGTLNPLRTKCSLKIPVLYTLYKSN